MTRTCCVPGCKTNLRSEIKRTGRLQVFNFPQDNKERERWLKGLNTKSKIKISENTGVCVKHFKSGFLKPVEGKDHRKLRLSKDACPSIVDGKENKIPRCSPDYKKIERKIKIKEVEDLKQNKDEIENYDILSSSPKLHKIVNETGYVLYCKPSELFCIKLEEDIASNTINSICIQIKNDLNLQVFYNGYAIKKNTYSSYLSKQTEICSWNNLGEILKLASNYNKLKHEDVTHRLLYIVEEMEIIENKLHEDLDDPNGTEIKTEILHRRIAFMREHHLKNFSLGMPRYSTNMIIFACSLYYSYPAAYRKLRDTNMLVLPHPSYLKRMEGKVSSLGSGLDESHKNYIKEKRKLMDPRNSIASILFDEIYTKPEIRYSGGQLHGQALNSSKSEAATTVQAFMVKSLFSKDKDVVALYPVKTLTSQLLLTMTLEVLGALAEAGYTIVCLVSDNNRVNRKMFEMLCNGNLQTCIPHPYKPDEKLFLLFDTVHIFKNIRNNWLNQFFQTFVLPNPDNFNKLQTATFYHLKLVYEREKDLLVKMAPGLCNKALSPSSLERQNVALVQKLANEKTISALEEYKESFPGIETEAIEGTISFLKMYVSWWSVVNVKSVSKGFHLRSPLMKPVHKEECLQLEFLRTFFKWMDAWDKIKVIVPEGTVPKRREARLGKLTLDTHLAIKHTTEALIGVSTYCLTEFKELGVKYVLLGYFQDDSIERRFGHYRTMNGASYHITVDQILQSERKMKVISLLKYKLKEGNSLSFEKLREFSSDEAFFFSDDVLQEFETAFEESLLLEVSDDIMKVLVTIAGYCAKKIKDKNKCEKCFTIVSTNTELENVEIPENLTTYMKNYNRGGLKVPTDIALNLVLGGYKLFTLLTSEKYEKSFILAGHQKQLFLYLLKDVVGMFFLDNELCPSCETPITSLLMSCLLPLSNILLNNYTKKINDKSHGIKLKESKERYLKKQRKLNTLKK